MIGLLLFFSPLPLWLVYLWVKKQVRKWRGIQPVESAQLAAYEPAPVPTAGWWLRRFNEGERLYLREQWSTARVGFAIVAWAFLTSLGAALLPYNVNGRGLVYDLVLPVTQPLERRVWISFVSAATLDVYAGMIIAILTALTIGTGLITTPTGNLTRTRPITHRFRYWARTLMGLASMLGGYGTGLGLAFLLLLAFYGPVWRHLDMPAASKPEVTQAVREAGASKAVAPAAAAEVTDEDSPEYDKPASQEARHVRWLRESAPAKLFVSTATTMLLVSSMFTLFLCQPLSGVFRKKAVPRWSALLIGPASYFLFKSIFMSAWHATVLFVYTAGPPPVVPPWHWVWVPLLVAAVTFCLGNVCCARIES